MAETPQEFERDSGGHAHRSPFSRTAKRERAMDEIRNLISHFESAVRQHDSCLPYAPGKWRSDLVRRASTDRKDAIPVGDDPRERLI